MNKKYSTLNYLIKGKSPTWCKGCGDFGVLRALTKSLEYLNIPPHNVSCISGIGCSSRLPLWLNTYGFHSCHGRAIPIATGLKMTRPDLEVITIGGDGDLYSIGIGHLVHAAQKNIDITVICMDNNIYALTKNQKSPTSNQGKKTTTTPTGTLEKPMRILEILISSGATFLAQVFIGKLKDSTEIITQAIKHKGFSFINIMSPCPTFNIDETFKYYRENTIDINSINTKNDDSNIAISNINIATNVYNKIPVGVLYNKPNILQYNSFKNNNKISNSHIQNLIENLDYS